LKPQGKTELEAALSAVIELNEAGQPAAFRWLIRDITERNQAQAALRQAHETLEKQVAERTADLRQANEQLEQLNRGLQDFAFIASHDLQEPLRKIRAFSERIRLHHAQGLDKQGQDFLLRMQRAADRMETMVADLLVYARVTTQAKPFTVVDLNQVAREVVSDLVLQIERTKGKVELGELPTIEADEVQMRQLLQNLIGNALKFHRSDAPPRVRVFCYKLEKTGAALSPAVQIMVDDNGIGFDLQNLKRIMQPFQRLHGMHEYEGTGIGLSICQKIVERHQGEITARSQRDQGTTFIITLPIRQKAAG
jgi:light-regulated signal transduction histidine kinase (bacteriophytochrome)